MSLLINKIIRNISFTTISQIIIAISGLLLLSHLGRVLGPNYFGIYNVGYAIFAITMACIDLGLPTYGIREIALRKFDFFLVKQITGLRLIFSGVIFSIFGIILFFFLSSEIIYWISWLFILCLIPYSITLDWVYCGLEMMEMRSLLRVITAIGVLLVCFVWIDSQEDLLYIPLIYFGIFFLTAIISIVFLKNLKECTDKKIKKSEISIKKILSYSLPIWITQILSLYLINTDLLILALFTTADNVGYYSASSRILASTVSIICLTFIPFYPFFCRINASRIGNINVLCFITKILSLFSFLFICILTLLTPILISLLYGSQYVVSINFMRVLLWYIPFALLNTIYSWYLLSLKRDREYLIIVGITAFMMTLLVSVGSLLFGVPGTTCSVVIAYIFSFFLYYHQLKDEMGEKSTRDIFIISNIFILGFILILFSQRQGIDEIFSVIGVSILLFIFIVRSKFIDLSEIKEFFSIQS